MKKTSLFILFLFTSTLLLAQKIITGRVIKVADGDTFTLLDSKNNKLKIRLYGVDCPEKNQPYYEAAKNFTSKSVLNKTVRVEVKNKDFYQRHVGVVWTPNKTNLNLALLRNGLAWHYIEYDKSKLYQNAENAAKTANKNIWSDKKAQAPWDFRKQKKKKK